MQQQRQDLRQAGVRWMQRQRSPALEPVQLASLAPVSGHDRTPQAHCDGISRWPAAAADQIQTQFCIPAAHSTLRVAINLSIDAVWACTLG
jgi:hypothetical protein